MMPGSDPGGRLMMNANTDIQTIGNGGVSVDVPVPEGFESRQERARKACEAAGIVWPGTILPPGTALYSSGVETLKNDRAAWRRLPLAGEVVGLVRDALKAEERRDYPANVANLRLRPLDGRIVSAKYIDEPRPNFGLGYGPHTLRQLVAQIDPLDDAPRGFASALLYLSDQERAEIVNKRIAKTSAETAVTLRTRLPHEGDTRIARAALSKVYGSVTDHDVAMALGDVLSGDASGRLDYKPGDQRSRFEIIWPSEIPIETFVVGDVHYGMLSITNSETGEGSLRIAPAVVRARCANLTISIGEGTEVVIRHIGDAEQLVGRLKRAIRAALDDMDPLLNVISASGRIPVEVWTPEKALGTIAKRYALPAATADGWVEQFKKSQYPATVWGLGAAIEEAAHKGATWVDEHEQERVASLVMARSVEVVQKGTPAAMAFEKALSLN